MVAQCTVLHGGSNYSRANVRLASKDCKPEAKQQILGTENNELGGTSDGTCDHILCGKIFSLT